MSAGAAAGASSTWGCNDHYFVEKCVADDCVQGKTGNDLLDTIAGGLDSPVLGQLASDSAKWDGDSDHYLTGSVMGPLQVCHSQSTNLLQEV